MTDSFFNFLIALTSIVGAYLAYKQTTQRGRIDEEKQASDAWREIYEKLSPQVEYLQKEVKTLKQSIADMEIKHEKEVEKLEGQIYELKEENRLLREENDRYKKELTNSGL